MRPLVGDVRVQGPPGELLERDARFSHRYSSVRGRPVLCRVAGKSLVEHRAQYSTLLTSSILYA